jgi:FkbM family methyltransferase
MVPELLTITPTSYKYPLTMRRADTDTAVVRQVLALEEYREVSSLDGIHLIVDCGANIGVSAYYFLHHYPHSRLIAIEPDERNCNLCRRNLEPFGARAIVLQAAVWSEARPLRIAPSSRTRGSWAFRVEPASAQTADVEGLTIHGILERAGLQGPIDLLKIDIEGAELEVFRQSPAWLDMVRHIAVELHSPAARQAFLAALAPYDHTMDESGESTIVRDLRRRPPSPTRG